MNAQIMTLTGSGMQDTEDSYRQFWALEGVEPVFPKHYPTSCLLGCVDIHDCLRVSPIL